MNIDTLVERVRAEFIELPGMRLTEAQARRLWDLDLAACQKVLDLLVQARFLRRTSTGTIMRAD